MKRTYGLNPIANGFYNSTLYQPQMTNHFEVNILLNKDLQGGNDETQIANMQKYITLATTDFSLPQISTEPIDIPYGNGVVHIAGKTQYGGANSLTCIDYIGADIERIIYNWQMMVTNPETGQQGWAYNYKTDATVLEYAPDGSCISAWILRGVFPTNVAYGDGLSKASANIKNVAVTLSYDLAYKKFGDNGRTTAKGRPKTDAAAEAAATNMAWKNQKDYAEENTGGPLDSREFAGNDINQID